MVKTLLRDSGSSLEELDLLVLHQANAFMLEYLRRMIGLPAEKVPVDLDGFGNTSSTSIPLVLSRHPALGTPDASNVVFCGFGAGLSWGAVRADLGRTRAISTCLVPQPHQEQA